MTGLDARYVKVPQRFEFKAPRGSPNVVIVLIDDIGFGHASAFLALSVNTARST